MFPRMNYDFESVFGYKPDAVGIDQLETFTNHHALVIWKLKISREKKKELFMTCSSFKASDAELKKLHTR